MYYVMSEKVDILWYIPQILSFISDVLDLISNFRSIILATLWCISLSSENCELHSLSCLICFYYDLDNLEPTFEVVIQSGFFCAL